jgi:AcrR family transcriptional regulator
MTKTGVLNDAPEANRAVEIFRAAAEIIHVKGFHATSISEIADAVRLTKAGLYYYIKGKEDLLYAIMSYGMDLLERHVVAPARLEAKPEDRLRSIVASHARLITNDGRAITILVNELAGLTEEHRRQMMTRQRSYFEFIRDTLEALRSKGRLNEVDTTVAAFSLLGTVLWVSRWYRPGGRLSAEQVVEEIVRLTLGGLVAPAPTEATDEERA